MMGELASWLRCVEADSRPYHFDLAGWMRARESKLDQHFQEGSQRAEAIATVIATSSQSIQSVAMIAMAEWTGLTMGASVLPPLTWMRRAPWGHQRRQSLSNGAWRDRPATSTLS
ncbi:MAG: hypothetical protein WA864_03520 [Acetobacteraceae bacterium]